MLSLSLYSKTKKALPVVLLPMLTIFAWIGSANAMLCQKDATLGSEVLGEQLSSPRDLMLSSQLEIGEPADVPTRPHRKSPVQICTVFEGDDCTLNTPLHTPAQPELRELHSLRILLPGAASPGCGLVCQMVIAMCNSGQAHPGYGREIYRPPRLHAFS